MIKTAWFLAFPRIFTLYLSIRHLATNIAMLEFIALSVHIFVSRIRTGRNTNRQVEQ